MTIRQHGLRAKHYEILAYIKDYLARHREAPTLGQIARRFGFKARSSAHDALVALERAGLIRRIANIPRGIVVIDTASLTQQAFNTLKDAIAGDAEYAWGWHCNIAMASVDEGMDHAAANRAAARFMFTCFGVDTSRSAQYASLKLDEVAA